MRWALLSDVHGNEPALEAVLRDVDRAAPDRVLCLGDTVGYGAQPGECLARVRDRCDVVLRGNHEHAILFGTANFTPLARVAADWTAQQLRGPDDLGYLARLSPSHAEGAWRLVHGSLADPLNDYVRESDSAWMFYQLVRTLREEFNGFDLCFVGHNHRAFMGTEVGFLFPHADGGQPCHRFRVAGQKAYVSVGSVGQPRDGDPRASWVLFDGETVEYRRVPYDHAEAMRRIAAAGLPGYLAERLAHGQ